MPLGFFFEGTLVCVALVCVHLHHAEARDLLTMSWNSFLWYAHFCRYSFILVSACLCLATWPDDYCNSSLPSNTTTHIKEGAKQVRSCPIPKIIIVLVLW